MMTSSEIRQSYLDFFKSKGHTIVPSSSLLPQSPNLLFTNSGMNQFVPIFLNQIPSPYSPPRAADTQKCIRAGGKHNDLEDVGLDTYHHTFFEMLGNWSFGDYFKKEAIAWAWELVIERWKLPPSRLYATVYKPEPGDPAEFDQEAYDLWSAHFRSVGLDPAVHVCYGNKKDNFWMMGETGPCGPCSELHVDLTPNGDCGPSLVNAGTPQCMEIWNLVFIQFNANPDGTFSPLPARHVDTGMGFERITGIIQCTDHFKDFSGVISNYNSDIFKPIFEKIESLSGYTYTSTLPSNSHLSQDRSPEEKQDIAFRVLADHIRTVSFAIADGIEPSNEGRGYVIRRILRRAARYGRELGLNEPFFYKLVSLLAKNMGDIFPEIRERQKHVEQIIQAEEESFLRTLDRGLELFESISHSTDSRVIRGKDAFKLYDTYGFPLDLTQLIAREKGLTVDTTGFEFEMEKQRERSKASQKREIISAIDSTDTSPTEFIGYDTFEKKGLQELQVDTLANKKQVLYFTPTPFYAEMGGQVGDRGWIECTPESISIQIIETQKAGSAVAHLVQDTPDLKRLLSLPPSSISVRIDIPRRKLTQAHHSATHLLHWALRKELGTKVQQKGSYVGPDRLRFDFSHPTALTKEEIQKLEELINQKIEEDYPVTWEEKPYEEIKHNPSILQFFGEKYGKMVRVVNIGEFSKELCGGTHVLHTKEIGRFQIVSEGAISAGVRRIEAVSGKALEEYLRAAFKKQNERYQTFLAKKMPSLSLTPESSSNEISLLKLQQIYSARENELKKIEAELLTWEKEFSKKKEQELAHKASEYAQKLALQIQKGAHGRYLIATLQEEEAALLPLICDKLKKEADVMILTTSHNGRAHLLISVEQAVQSKLQANQLMQKLAPIIGGKGGGRPQLAQGSGSEVNKITTLIEEVEKICNQALL